MQISIASVVTVVVASLLSTAVAKAQDECSTALPIVSGANGPFSNSGMTASTTTPVPSCAATSFNNDLWLVYTSLCSGSTTIDTCGTTGDSVLQIYDGTAGCGALVAVGCNDDSCGLSSSVTFTAVAGGIYYVRLDTFGTAIQTAFTVNVNSCPPPTPGDDCSGALPLVLGFNGGLTNVGATAGTTLPCSFNGSAVKDIWYSYTAACTAPHTFSTCSSTMDTVIEVLDNCTSLTSLGCNDDSCALQSELTVNLTAGTSYLIRCGGWNNATGTFSINIESGTGAGTITPSTTVSLCPSAATLSVTGNPNIGNAITIAITGNTGFGLVAYGFAPNVTVPTPCGCDVVGGVFGLGGGELFFSATLNITIPKLPALIGVSAEIQGIDAFPTSGGCTFAGIPFGATDITTVTIG